MSPLINEGTDLALRFGTAGGKTLVHSPSPLTRLNYFDGKFLRADDLRREQDYIRQLVQFSNQGMGAGVVYGMDTVLGRQSRISIGPGLAMDSTGRTLLISETAAFDIASLIDSTRRVPKQVSRLRGRTSAEFDDCIDLIDSPGDDVVQGRSLYVICVGHAESLCGIEDVYGRLCEEACVTATDRPLIVEGVVVRALPLILRTPLPMGRDLDRRHLRSQVASAFFEDERRVVGSLISRAGLALDTWCVGADAASVGCVPLAVVAVAGTSTIFLDAWTVRRERIEAPAKRYWAWRMAMRPWDVYLAHILQFQCQLHEALGGAREPGGDDDPCRDQSDVLADADRYLAGVEKDYRSQIEELMRASGTATMRGSSLQPPGGLASLSALRARLGTSLRASFTAPRTRVLINAGIIELPSAGYLPVVEGGTISVNTQVRRLLGEGVDLRFCIVRHDYVPHALEEAQHMERISLIAGLEDAKLKPEVDILVPYGEISTVLRRDQNGWDSTLSLNVGERTADGGGADRTPVELRGAGRSEKLKGGGAAFYFAGAQEVKDPNLFIRFVRDVGTLNTSTLENRERVLRRMPVTADAPLTDRDIVTSRLAASLISRVTLAGGRTAPPATEVVAPIAAGWVSLQIQADPFELQVAETTPVSLEASLTMLSGERRLMMRSQVTGTFRPTQAPVGGVERRLRGRISGLSRMTTEIGDSEAANESSPMEADVDLVITGDAAAGTLKATVINAARKRFGYSLEAKWEGTPLSATVTLSGGLLREGVFEAIAGNAPPQLAVANVVRSETALQPGSDLRTMSTTAIEALGREMGEPDGAGFADASSRALFPPPPPPSEELTVRATRDWVLFHRRRTKKCAQDIERPAPPRVRKYQVYHYKAVRTAEVQPIRDALRTGAALTGLEFDRAGIVEYAAGQATLLSDYQDSWRSVAPGNVLLYGAIATAGEEDSVSLENARLTRIAGAVASITASDGKTLLEAIPDVPAALRVAGTDGIVFLVSRQVLKVECQRVFAVADMSVWKQIQDIMRRSTDAEFIDQNVETFFRRNRLFELGRPRFDKDTGAPTDATQIPPLATLWNATAPFQGRVVLHRAIWIPQNDPSAQRHETQSGAIAAVVRASAQMTTDTVSIGVAPVSVSLGEANPEKRCPVITFLVAGGRQ